MKRPKFGNRKTVVDGITFDSAAEARRWQELLLLQRAGEICELNRQVEYALIVNNTCLGKYRADFVYRWTKTGDFVREDVKGFRTPEYKLKAKIMAATGRPITEVKA